MADRLDRDPGSGPATVSSAGNAYFPLPTLRPCRVIGGGDDDGLGAAPMASRYAALTRPLALAGGMSMRPSAGGGTVLIEELRRRMPWCLGAIGVVERQVAVAGWAGRPWLDLRPMVLVGPPGGGKSHFARLLADVAGLASAAVNLGGVDDVRHLAGTSRGWSSAQPSWPAVVMAGTRTANPALILEEIDKVDRHRGRAVFDVLLAMTERVTAAAYYDTALLADVDLSACNFIMTANGTVGLPAALASRVDVVRVDPPGPDQFDPLVAMLLDAVAGRWGVPRTRLPELPRRALVAYRDEFARRGCLRLLARRLEDGLATLIPASPSLH